MMERQAKILEVVRLVSPVKDAQPSPNESLFESGILDSFGLPDLVAALENEFKLSIPDSDLKPKNFLSIQAIETYLQART